MILLLDGFNELSEVYEAKFGKEIRGLAQYPGMQIIVTSREDFTGRYNLRFQKALLCELVDDQIQKVLTQQEWIHIQGQYTLHQLLKNPMLLLMYKQVCPVMDRHQDAFLTYFNESQLKADAICENIDCLECEFFNALKSYLPCMLFFKNSIVAPRIEIYKTDIDYHDSIREFWLPEDYDFEAHKELVPMQPGDVSVTYADTSALERDFGFKPSTSLREGLRRFAEWYKTFYL